ncbi:MAG TPA: TetR/AcrR family transcriptional regulator [Solirubrobacterales bacterium]|nr:TetR/AcrR family transcriptional regulator [Solirubrobacterales bacterium]
MERVGRGVERRLPTGPHGIPADVVARNQRERLIAAMAEVCAERGYAHASVAGVAKRAGVSSVTFYKQFADKRDCMLATHRQLLGRLLEAVDAAGSPLPTLLSLLAADPPSTRLLTVEILAAGPEGAKRQDAMVKALAERLGVDWVRAAGIVALIGKCVMAGEADRLPELENEVLTSLSSQG